LTAFSAIGGATMRRDAYPEIGRRITISQGRGASRTRRFERE
jgi:hypothetical protein